MRDAPNDPKKWDYLVMPYTASVEYDREYNWYQSLI